MTNKTYCKCPYCGSECEVDTSIVLASIPPQYQGFCEKCNKVIYTLCSNTYGKISMEQGTSDIVKDAEYRNDIHRIADALEKLAKHFESEKSDKGVEDYLKKVSGEYNPVKCPYCGSSDIEYTFGKTSISTSGTKLHYFCKHCHMEFDADNKNEVKEMTDEEKEKLSKEYIKKYLDLTTAPSPSVTPNTWPSCEGCWYYEQRKFNPNYITIVGDTPCTWCPKMQPTCTSNLSSEIKCSENK